MPHNFVPDRIHIRNVMLFLFLSGLKPPAIHEQLEQVYPTHTPHVTTVRKWVVKFEKHDFSLEDEDRPGRPMELDLDRLRSEVEADPYLTTRDLADFLGVDQKTAVNGLHAIGKKWKLGRWIPHDLTDYDKDRRVDMASTLLTLHRRFDWLDNVITGDEKWVLYDNHERMRQWVGEDQKPADVPKPDLHPKKVMLCIWWSVRGVEFWELLPEGTTITAEVYTLQLRKLRLAVEQTRGKDARIYFQHDNARPHVARKTKAELAGYGWTVLPHPPYSPDLAPSDYHLFSDLQRFLKGQSFKDRATIQTVLTNYFKNQPQSFYHEGIHKLPGRWQKVIDAHGEYF